MVRRYYDFSAIPAPTKPKEGTHWPAVMRPVCLVTAVTSRKSRKTRASVLTFDRALLSPTVVLLASPPLRQKYQGHGISSQIFRFKIVRFSAPDLPSHLKNPVVNARRTNNVGARKGFGVILRSCDHPNITTTTEYLQWTLKPQV